MKTGDLRGRLVAVEALLQMIFDGLEKQVPEETEQFIRDLCARTRSAIEGRGNIIAFPGLRHAVSDDAMRYVLRLLESRLPVSDGPEGADAAWRAHH